MGTNANLYRKYQKFDEPIKGGIGSREYVRIRNNVTGEIVMIDKGLSRAKKVAMGFMNTLRLSPYYVKHIILTQSKESYKPNILHSFFTRMRQVYGNIVYLWTAEIQEERLQNTGEAVLHWHIICGFEWDGSKRFDSDDVKQIQKFWKFGDMRNSVEVRKVFKPSFSYLMKYMTKAIASEIVNDFKLHRVGSSRIAGWLRQSWSRLTRAIDYLVPRGIGVEMFDQFYWSNGNAYAYTFDQFMFGGREHSLKQKILIYKRAASEWSRIENFVGEPF